MDFAVPEKRNERRNDMILVIGSGGLAAVSINFARIHGTVRGLARRGFDG